MKIPTLEAYLRSLSALDHVGAFTDPETLETCKRATRAVIEAENLTVETLADIVQSDCELVPVFAAVAGFSQERFKTWLTARFGTAGWKTLARERPIDLISAIDADAGLVELLETQSLKAWTWADVIASVMSQRLRGGSAVQSGRNLEDFVEASVIEAGLNFEPRTRFIGTNAESAPADFAIPGGGADAEIVIAIKEFHSTGSKLSDAAREIEEMAKVRRPTQFVYAIVDGQGWHRRRGDLEKILKLWEVGRIDGVYTRNSLREFKDAVVHAWRIVESRRA
jgi:DpnII restriction endonuclease.